MHQGTEKKVALMVAAIRAIADGIDNAMKMSSSASPEARMALDSGASQGRELLRYALDTPQQD